MSMRNVYSQITTINTLGVAIVNLSQLEEYIARRKARLLLALLPAKKKIVFRIRRSFKCQDKIYLYERKKTKKKKKTVPYSSNYELDKNTRNVLTVFFR